MDAYSDYRSQPPARSPAERTSYSGRDDGYRAERTDARTDTFYRGRSPGMSILVSRLTIRALLSYSYKAVSLSKPRDIFTLFKMLILSL